jgi:transposase
VLITQMSLDLESLSPDVGEFVKHLQAENLRLQMIVNLKDEQIRLLNIRHWGPKADKLSENQLALLPQELIVAAPEVEREAEVPEKDNALAGVLKAKSPRARHPGRTTLPAHLERREEIIACHPGDCTCCVCGQPRPIIGYEVREELGCRPAEFFVRVIKREKRGSHCLPEQGVAVAPAPAQIVPKSKLSDELIIEVLAAKFQQHTPVYRQCASLLEDHGIELSRQTLNEGILAAAQLLVPVVRAQATELLAGDYLQADETTVPCQVPEATGKNHIAYLWEYGRPGGAVVFDFRMGRGRKTGPGEFLKNFRGKLQCDGYAAYDKLGEDITFVACMAHIRRKFVDTAKLTPLDPLPVEIVHQIGLLYSVEAEARSQNFTPVQRQELRNRKSRPVMTALKARILHIRGEISPDRVLAAACDYALAQWDRMEQYLQDGQVEIDNNWCEGAMRPIALGRRNWLHLGDETAGPKIAAIISIVETCRRLDIKLRQYLGDVLPKLGTWPITRVAELTPTAWKAARCR